MFCSKCGKNIKDNSKFCCYCGTAIYSTKRKNESKNKFKFNDNEITLNEEFKKNRIMKSNKPIIFKWIICGIIILSISIGAIFGYKILFHNDKDTSEEVVNNENNSEELLFSKGGISFYRVRGELNEDGDAEVTFHLINETDNDYTVGGIDC